MPKKIITQEENIPDKAQWFINYLTSIKANFLTRKPQLTNDALLRGNDVYEVKVLPGNAVFSKTRPSHLFVRFTRTSWKTNPTLRGRRRVAVAVTAVYFAPGGDRWSVPYWRGNGINRAAQLLTRYGFLSEQYRD